jgi:hypothetical protein
VDDEFCSNFADGDGFDFLDIYLSLDGWMGVGVLVPLRLKTPMELTRMLRSCFFL